MHLASIVRSPVSLSYLYPDTQVHVTRIPSSDNVVLGEACTLEGTSSHLDFEKVYGTFINIYLGDAYN